MVAHAVQDDTLLGKYLPRVREFLKWAICSGAKVTTISELDFTLADYFELGCYKWGKTFDWCSSTFFGILSCFPEFNDALPVAYRAYKAFKRMFVGNEGQAIPEEVVYVMADRWRKRQQLAYAMICETSMDVYWRQGEWELLRGQDASDDGKNIAFTMGVALRGERVKTGHNQGVIIDSPVLTKEWREYLQKVAPHEKIFPITQQDFYRAWEELKKELGLPIGPPHDLRHSGAARDIASQRRTLEEVRRRGRWRSMDSVARYTKTFLLVAARTKVPRWIMQEGARLAEQRR